MYPKSIQDNTIQLKFHTMEKQKIIIITGNKGSGKTTMAYKYIDSLKKRGVNIGGVITKSETTKRYEKKLSYSVVDIQTNVSKELLTSNRSSLNTIKVGRFSMNQEALIWATEKIESASKICSAVMIDELGPAELKGLGYSGIAKELINRYKGLIILVVRIEILEQVRSYFNCDPETTSIVDVENSNKLNNQLLNKVLMNE